MSCSATQKIQFRLFLKKNQCFFKLDQFESGESKKGERWGATLWAEMPLVSLSPITAGDGRVGGFVHVGKPYSLSNCFPGSEGGSNCSAP